MVYCVKCGATMGKEDDFCNKCGTAVDKAKIMHIVSNIDNANAIQLPSNNLTFFGVVGLMLVIFGVCQIVYMAFFFDVTVAVSHSGISDIYATNIPDRVNNIGLMSDKQNGLISGFGCTILGLALGYYAHKKK